MGLIKEIMNKILTLIEQLACKGDKKAWCDDCLKIWEQIKNETQAKI